MDFRGFSKCASSRLAVPSTVLTPQLENYDLFHGYRQLPKTMSSEEGKPFMLAFNLASVMESELKITRVNTSTSQVLEIEVVHSRREAEGVSPFARDCNYRFNLSEDLYDKPLTALWTIDHHLIVVESSNFIEVLTAVPKSEEDVDMQVEGSVVVIKPKKVNCLFKPTLDIDILRQSVIIAELGLMNAKRIIQNGSFTCPDIDRKEKKIGSTIEGEKHVEASYERGVEKVIRKSLNEQEDAVTEKEQDEKKLEETVPEKKVEETVPEKKLEETVPEKKQEETVPEKMLEETLPEKKLEETETEKNGNLK